MMTEKARLFSCLLLSFLISFLVSMSGSTPTDSADLREIADDYWNHILQESIYLRIKLGLPIQSLPDITYEKAGEQAVFAKSLLDRLEKIDASRLSHQEFLSLEILKWECTVMAEAAAYYWLTSAVTPYSSPIPEVQRAFLTHRFAQPTDLHQYSTLLKQLPLMVLRIRQFMETQLGKGIVLPGEEIEIVKPFLESYAAGGEDSPFYVSSDRLKEIPETEAVAFQREILAMISDAIVPSFRKLIEFISGEYLKKAPDHVGLWQYPNGTEYYRYLVRYHTTLHITPEEVHRIGLETVRRLDAEMKKIRDSLPFEGSKREFHAFLKSDDRFIPETPEEIARTLISFDQRIQPEIDNYFLRRPKAPYIIKRLDPQLEGSMTFGYYEEPSKSDPQGIYYYNGSHLSERPLFNSGSITYHELVPGHHFQLSLQTENEALPDFRRNAYPTAFIEGWAEYASGLAGEMGMYRDPYERYGRLAAEIFLAVRLVVDTGMNHLSWTRSRAADFMKEYVLESDTQIYTETLRYAVDMPGQALAYKMGSMKIVELREKAQKELGTRFDIRKFHDSVLGSGSMPLAVLEKHIHDFIQIENLALTEGRSCHTSP